MKRCSDLQRASYLWMLLLVAFPRSSMAQEPAVFWASTPVQPGETVLFYGDGMERVDDIRLLRLANAPGGLPRRSSLRQSPAGGLPCKPLQPSQVSVKCILPPELQPGVFVAWVHTPDGWSQPVFLNEPNPWWVQGDWGTIATPGGWVRVLGTSLGWPEQQSIKPRLALVGTAPGKPVFLEISQSTAYSVKASLPQDLPEGRYQVWVHNGLGDANTWVSHLSIQVQKLVQWPTAILNVKDFGASGDGSQDDTGAIAQALERAGREGGGIIYLPRGLYKVTSLLRIPPKTILRGERQDLVDLFWPDEGPMLPAVIQGTHSFGIEDLTLHFTLAQHGIVADVAGPQAGNIFLRRVRARWLLYSGHLKPETVDQRFQEFLQLSSGGGDLVRLTGRNIEVADCDLYSSGRVLVLQNVEGTLIAGNTLYNGRWGWYSISGGERIIFEKNQVIGADLMATGGGVNSLGGMPTSQYVYFAHNTFKNLYGWDREAMTIDGGGGDYIGIITSATSTAVTYPSPQGWKSDSLKGKACYILDGKGKGQYRVIVSNADRTLTLERPWDVVPDSTSVVGITWMRGHYLFIGNTAVDASIAIQLYGVAFNSVVADNRSVRAGGFRSYAMRYLGDYNVPITQGIQPQMFIQYLNNRVVEGSSYHMGANSGSVVGLDASAPNEDWQWPMALGFVFRGNQLDSHTRLRLLTPGEGTPLIEDVVIEGNRVQDSPVGIEVGARSTRVVLRNNHFTQVTTPVIDHSQAAVQVASGGTGE
jgi:hypothetical protein